MNAPDARLTDLEVKFAFLEEHILQQDREILHLRALLEKQTAGLAHLRAELGADGLRVRDDERPPHY